MQTCIFAISSFIFQSIAISYKMAFVVKMLSTCVSVISLCECQKGVLLYVKILEYWGTDSVLCRLQAMYQQCDMILLEYK